MILDRLENAGLYRQLGAKFALAFDYLSRTDFSQVANGRYPLDGEEVCAVVMRYRPKPLAETAWEAHRQYIDVQYVAAGVERMGYAPLCNGLLARKEYDPKDDYVLYDVKGDLFEVHAGSFAIFTPHDVHAPGVARDLPEPPEEVCKVVVKCRVDDIV
jgi:biofilm protein TabA